MKAGDRIRVVKDTYCDGDESLVGYVGVVNHVWPDGDFRVDLDPEQCDENLTELYFSRDEVEPE